MSCHLGSLSSPRHMTYFRLDDKFHKNIYLGQTRPWQTTFLNQHTCKVKSYNVQHLFSALRSTLVIINFTMSNTLAEHLLTIGQIMNNSTQCIYSTLRSDKWWIWMHTMKQNSQHKEWFSTEWGKPKTKIISLANRKGHRKFNEPIKIQSKYMMQGKTYGTTD